MMSREWYKLIAKSKVTDRYTIVDKLLNPLSFIFLISIIGIKIMSAYTKLSTAADT